MLVDQFVEVPPGLLSVVGRFAAVAPKLPLPCSHLPEFGPPVVLSLTAIVMWSTPTLSVAVPATVTGEPTVEPFAGEVIVAAGGVPSPLPSTLFKATEKA